MDLKEKELLLVDLCGRLPYKPFVELDEEFGYNKGTRILNNAMLSDYYSASHIKPYLRPMSSMTEEEKNEFYMQNDFTTESFCNAHHLDYRGLIELGLALEAKEDMYGKKAGK